MAWYNVLFRIHTSSCEPKKDAHGAAGRAVDATQVAEQKHRYHGKILITSSNGSHPYEAGLSMRTTSLNLP